MKLTLKTFRELTARLPEDTPIMYHAYYKGCCLTTYTDDDLWIFPKGATSMDEVKAVVLNPGEDYDGRRPKKEES